jgi:Polysaccharide biosynthesis
MVNISTEIRSKYNIQNKLYIGVVLILLVLYIIYTNEHLSRYSSYYGTSTLVETAITTPSTTTATPSQRWKGDGAIKNPRLIDRSEATFPKEQVQMCWEQVKYILQHLPENGNLLVWGLGYDSIYWNTVTTGKVVFLEDGDMITNLVPNPNPNNPATMVRWFDSMTYQYPQLQAYTVNYTTQNSISQLEYYKNTKDVWDEQLYIHDLPDILSSTMWDVIIVDAPLGYPKTGPGRFQSIYMTKNIANHTLTLLSTEQPPQRREESAVTTKRLRNDQEHAVHVFVDDYERRVEREFALAVFHPVVPERVTPRPAYKQHVTPNEQAHFILSLSNMR